MDDENVQASFGGSLCAAGGIIACSPCSQGKEMPQLKPAEETEVLAHPSSWLPPGMAVDACSLSFCLFVCLWVLFVFVVVFRDRVSLSWLSWNSLCRSGWSRTHICLSLPPECGITGMCYHHRPWLFIDLFM